MNAEGKGLATIDFLELPRPTVKAIKLMDLLRKNLIRGLIAIYFAYPLLVSFQNIDTLDDFTRVLFEQKYEKLIFVFIEYVYQLLSLSAIELAW
jgi:hypothetical protein